MIRVGLMVQCLINLLREQLLDYDVIQMDETPVQVLKAPQKTATSKSYLWVQKGGPPGQAIFLFDYDPLRSQGAPLHLPDGLHSWLDRALPQMPLKTTLGKALYYLHRQWDKLVRYCDDGRLNIDNNPVERTIRPFVTGGKTGCFPIPLQVPRPALISIASWKPPKPMDWSLIPISATFLKNCQPLNRSMTSKRCYLTTLMQIRLTRIRVRRKSGVN